MMQKLSWWLLFLLVSGCGGVAPKSISSTSWHHATKEVVQQYQNSAEDRLLPAFQKAKVPYPPKKIALLAFKDERKVELWASQAARWHYIKTYNLTATSGGPGPKLREFDKQIPEGVYHITWLNPFSNWHLSMMLNYPNQMDRYYADLDGRTQLGNNIFIHGKAASVGCLAIGDKAINELFVLAYKMQRRDILVIIAPNDLRYETPLYAAKRQPIWIPKLYQRIAQSLQPFRRG